LLSLSLTAILRMNSISIAKKLTAGTNFATAYLMSHLLINDIIRSEKAKTVEQAFAVVQKIRATTPKREELVLDFSGITWITSQFADRLVRALATFYGEDFKQKLHVTGIEKTNVMFPSLWESAIEKFGLAEA
jgi:hypothetical protein